MINPITPTMTGNRSKVKCKRMYFTGTDGIKKIKPLNTAMTSVTKNNVSKKPELNIAAPPCLQSI